MRRGEGMIDGLGGLGDLIVEHALCSVQPKRVDP